LASALMVHKDIPSFFCVSVSFSLSSTFFQGVDAGAYFESRAEFDVQGAHQMVFGQQKQGLPVYLLGSERFCNVLTP
jgi:hypothetical protein